MVQQVDPECQQREALDSKSILQAADLRSIALKIPNLGEGERDSGSFSLFDPEI